MNKKKFMDFYKGKKVFITGHTGFKGSWLCIILKYLQAEIIGYSLNPPTNPNLFNIAKVYENITSIDGDVRDLKKLKKSFELYNPDIVLHLAAQPIVSEGYKNPVNTYETNINGTLNILECCRIFNNVKSVINVTTDKVYRNNEIKKVFREEDVLDGFDPYSNSKSCSELITHCYKKSFFSESDISVSTVRAGNVIGGGDFAKNRIIPDCIRAVENNAKIEIRNPNSVRPFQHVLEALTAYLMIAYKQYKNKNIAGEFNVGPEESNCVTCAEIADIFCELWGKADWKNINKNEFKEAEFLKLDCSKIKKEIGWKPVWNIRNTLKKTIEWEKAYLNKKDIQKLMIEQIKEYFALQFNDNV